MSREVFEVRGHDAAGRCGRLEVPRADVTLDTPALLPVVNPHIQDIPPRRIAEEFGAQTIITNAYVLHQSKELRAPAEEQGLSELLDFPGAIMTDSGSFQLAEYGQIDVGTQEILTFQDAIGSHIATPVDIPTPPEASRERARADLERTTKALQRAAAYDAGDMLVTAPVQGGSHADLRQEAARTAVSFDLDVYPLGAMVPLLRSYRFETVTEAVCAAKRGLGPDAPVHLFGAGHPMMFALGAALGCDLFDSAAYALYARDGRYMTVTGTDDVSDLRELPCSCPICLERTPDELAIDDRALAEHNLYVSLAEMRRVREAIRRGELLELVETRVRAHPHLLDGYRAALDHPDHLEASDPVSANRPFFSLSAESAERPAVRRHHRRLERITPNRDLLLVDAALIPESNDPDPWEALKIPSGIDSRERPVWLVIPPFGPVPPSLVHTYPLTAEVPTRRDTASYRAAIHGIEKVVTNMAGSVSLFHDAWPSDILERIPDEVTVTPGTELVQ